tara:strand:- start:24 stop:416 length:393 start_codon:yes stop_codon:yes gene_type:complete
MNNNMDNLNQQDFQFLKEKLQSAVKEYLELDDAISALNKAVNERRKKRKQISEFILESMGKYEINNMNINKGKLVYQEKEVKVPLNKKNLIITLNKYFRNEEKAFEVTDYVMENRDKVKQVKLKRTTYKM